MGDGGGLERALICCALPVGAVAAVIACCTLLAVPAHQLILSVLRTPIGDKEDAEPGCMVVRD